MVIEPLDEFLNSKPLYYTKFDPNRIKKAYKLIKDKINHPQRVQIIGTNGKGSTGRALAFLAYKSGLNVGHFSSPHIMSFKERFWINNSFASDDILKEAHNKLYNMLGKDVAVSLSYFEYQALLAFVLYENCDLQVMEAGLGGEYDATSVVTYDLNLITPIGFDHSDFLGDSLKDIASTKLKAVDKRALISFQTYKEVLEIAKNILKDKEVFYIEDFLKNNHKTFDIIKYIASKKSWPNFLVQNIYSAVCALDILKIDYNLDNLNNLEIFGRFYKFKKNIIIDVGHNALAANAIKNALNNKVTLIFNILSDKDALSVLKILKPKINEVLIIKIDTKRAIKKEKLIEILNSLNIKYRDFNGTLDKNKNYLVFGSFYTVQAFLKSCNIDNF
jgi:dihydrofolate synthase/folylpolyglutamate synthase